MIIILTPRLSCIYSHITGKIIADIGTDHAYIPIELAKNNRIRRAFACDINKGPCDIARANIENEGFSDIIEVRLGGGLSVIEKGEADEIIIAGMGGKLICDILAADLETAAAARLVLQPMNAQAELRHFLIDNGFKITGEDLEIEGFKVYNILTAEKGEQSAFEKQIDYHIPPSLYSHRCLDQLLRKKTREFTKILDGLKLSSQSHSEKIGEYEQLLTDLKSIKRQVNKNGTNN